jgi:DNA-binding transcriptional ArsR family regulator
MNAVDVIAKLAALAQPTRLAIYRLLVERGPDGVIAGVVAEVLNVPPATLSFHFKTLSHAGLIVSKQEGRFVYYAANYQAMNEMVGYLTENCCGGDASVCQKS